MPQIEHPVALWNDRPKSQTKKPFNSFYTIACSIVIYGDRLEIGHLFCFPSFYVIRTVGKIYTPIFLFFWDIVVKSTKGIELRPVSNERYVNYPIHEF